VDTHTPLREENLESLRSRAHEYFMTVNRPVGSEELAKVLFKPQMDESVSPLLVRTLLSRDRRFSESSRGLWELSSSPYRHLRLQDAAFAVVDLEATGSRLGVDRIIEVAVVRVDHGCVRRSFNTLVNPLQPVPHWIQGLTGIKDSMLQDAPRFHQVAPRVLELLKGSVFVAHNVDFDYPFLRRQVRESGHRPHPWPQLCTVRLSRRMHPEWGAFRLGAVARRLEVPLKRHHRAIADATATAQVLLRELKELQHQGIGTVGEVLAFARSAPAPAED